MILGRVDEYNAFIKSRATMLKALNDPNARNVEELNKEYLKSIPQWVNDLEQPLLRLYEAAFTDGRRGGIR